jgi:hypothetical protein
MTNVICTDHAVTRAQQRGITPAQMDAVLRYADMEARRGDGCASIWISRRELQRLGPLTPDGISTDRLQDLTLLQGADGSCVTLFRNCKSKAYRRNVGVADDR